MRKALLWVWENILFVATLFLLAFIPLYPKLPLLDVVNTWVYIRLEDFVVLFVLLLWIMLLFRKKITLKTPLTVPILIFWIIGVFATIHGVVIIFPKLANVYPNVAFGYFIRHIEYMSLFFVAYAAMREKRFLIPVIGVLIVTLLAVVAYGIGQKYFGFPAYLTMNEEFAKGVPIQLSSLSRVPSTFAGHYDLAAYLVLVIPIFVSLFFGFKSWFVKIGLALTTISGVVLLFMTVSRVSFFVLFVSVFVVFLFQKKRFLLFLIPGALLIGFLFFFLQPSLLARFSNTIAEVDVLVDAKTGQAIGHVKFVKSEYLRDKIIKQTLVKDKAEVDEALTTGKIVKEVKEATDSAKTKGPKYPPEIPLVVATNASTGENLPQGTGYINLSLSPVSRRLGNFFYELGQDAKATTSAEVIILHGNFLIKRAAAYDLSFTTRFQGEWPRALSMFERNVLFGSGYGSVSLAVDNNYLRLLGEIGLLGAASFFAIFLALGIYIKKILPDVDSSFVRSFVIGFIAGVIGLALNAFLIDVFEASKIAFLLWILTGVTLGILSLYQKKPVNLYAELKKVMVSSYAMAIYLFIVTIALFLPMIDNFFVGDDFTWFRWAADCDYSSCGSLISRIYHYFLDSQGFFFRPGTKLYFLAMYSVFWLNQVVYHIVSVLLHFIVSVLFFLLARKVLHNNILAGIGALLFLLISGYQEAVFWISSTGYLFNAVFALAAILTFNLWNETGKKVYFVASIIFISLGFLFHEVGVVTPLLIIAYKITQGGFVEIRKTIRRVEHLYLFVPVLVYLLVRWVSGSHWFSGDYSYNLIKLPFNVIGNLIGYLVSITIGPFSLPLYLMLRTNLRENILIAVVLVSLILLGVFFGFRFIRKYLSADEKKIAGFGLSFFIIALLPFLGLGNITSRYAYLPTLGLILLLVLAIRKTYDYLLTYGRDIAIMSMGIIVAVFSLFHIMQLQQLHGDWHTAGDKVKRFFISIDELYSNSWSKESVKLHFVDVPIRSNEAWVFPVGLSDALWFAFQNDNLRVYVHPNLSDALSLAGTSLSDRVFKFHEDGSIEEVIRYKNGFPINVLVQ